MSEQLPAPNFDAQSYARPNQDWTCGHACEGQACRLGPDKKGRCQASFECSPMLEKKPGEMKGRWRCTRLGGACESGPLPDGTCCRAIPKCSPVPSLRLRRGQLTRALVIATLALLLVMLGSPPLRNRFLNPGQLSAPHSGTAFAALAGRTNRVDQTCAACHRAGAEGPTGLISVALHASPGPLEIRRLAAARPAEMTAIDESCQKCHPQHLLHQPNMVRDLSCSACHHEHRGAQMPAPDDANCAFCHGDAAVMANAAATGLTLPPGAFHSRISPGQRAFPAPRPAAGFTSVINHFATDHPEFRVHTENWRDPDTLKFNHQLHLTGATIPKLPGGQKLDCAFCHQPDAAGAYVRPVKFENNCRVCHSLQFDPETPALTLPHGDPKFVAAFLHSLPKQYADFAARTGVTGAAEQSEFASQKLQRLQTLAGSGEELEARVFFSSATFGPATQIGTVSGATRALFPGCAYCHEVKAFAGQPEITPPVLFDRWLVHSEFNHAKHAGIACEKCHAATQSRETADILLPAKESCVTCHSPRGGVANNCSECHRYHTANNP
jgi:hypothetical protein